jgi:hypothetical protein
MEKRKFTVIDEAGVGPFSLRRVDRLVTRQPVAGLPVENQQNRADG